MGVEAGRVAARRRRARVRALPPPPAAGKLSSHAARANLGAKGVGALVDASPRVGNCVCRAGGFCRQRHYAGCRGPFFVLTATRAHLQSPEWRCRGKRWASKSLCSTQNALCAFVEVGPDWRQVSTREAAATQTWFCFYSADCIGFRKRLYVYVCARFSSREAKCRGCASVRQAGGAAGRAVNAGGACVTSE